MDEQVVDAAETDEQGTEPQNMWSRPSESVDAINEQMSQEEPENEPANEPAEEPEESEPPIQEQDSQPAQDEEPSEELDASEDQGEPEEEPANETDEVPDKENPERFQYWQSKAQKTENELKELKGKYGDVDDGYVELAKNLEKDPKALEYLESYLNGDPKQPKPAPSNQQDPEQALKQLEKPTKPTKPEPYDKVDAVSDPESESYKYNQALLEYQEQLADYIDTKEDLKEQAIAKQRQQQQQQQQIEQQKQQVVTELKKGYGLSDKETQDFMDFMENTEQNIDNYVKFWRAMREPKKQKKRQPQPKPKSATKQPPPAGVTGGTSPKDPDRNMWGEPV